LATILRGNVARDRMQQRATACRVEGSQPLRAQRGNDAGQQVAHATDGHAGITGIDDTRRLTGRGNNQI
jgi:hypothetical protein